MFITTVIFSFKIYQNIEDYNRKSYFPCKIKALI